MCNAVAAIAAPEAGQGGHELSRLHQQGNKIALSTASNNEGRQVCGRVGQFIDMPAHSLAAPEMPREPGLHSPRPARAAEIDERAMQLRLPQSRSEETKRRIKADQQGIGSRHPSGAFKRIGGDGFTSDQVLNVLERRPQGWKPLARNISCPRRNTISFCSVTGWKKASIACPVSVRA